MPGKQSLHKHRIRGREGLLEVPTWGETASTACSAAGDSWKGLTTRVKRQQGRDQAAETLNLTPQGSGNARTDAAA